MEKEDLNNTQVVTEPKDLNKADSVGQQDLNNDSVNQVQQDGTLADGTDVDKTVKYSELKKATERAKAAEEQTLLAQRQLELIQANMQGQAQAQTNQQQPQTTLDQAMLNCSVEADDMFGEAQVRVFNEKSRLDAIQQQQQSATSANMQFIASCPDFTQVVGSVNPATGQIISWSQEALTLGQEQPWLRQASAQGMYLAIMNKRKLVQLEKNAAVNEEHLNRQEVDTTTQPLGGSAAGGGGAGDPNKQQMLTREQQIDIRRRLAEGEAIT